MKSMQVCAKVCQSDLKLAKVDRSAAQRTGPLHCNKTGLTGLGELVGKSVLK